MKKLILMLVLLSAPAMAETRDLELWETSARCSASASALGLSGEAVIALHAYRLLFRKAKGDDWELITEQLNFMYESGIVSGLKKGNDKITEKLVYNFYCSDENMKLFRKLAAEFNKEENNEN